jgi:RNA polymerase sigma-70 factor, ECF subfamily
MENPIPEKQSFVTEMLPLLGELERRARSYHPSPDDARDLVQATLEKALRNAGRFRPGTSARAWLLDIMFHLFVDDYRRRRRQQSEALPAEEPAAPEPEPPPWWESLEPAGIDEALARMKGPLREVLELRWRERCSYRQISARLQIPMATVATRLWRGRRHLRAALEAGV